MRGCKISPAIAYVVKNKFNGHSYIGITRLRLDSRLQYHFSSAKRKANNGAFYAAIREFGKDAFVAEKLMDFANIAEAIPWERKLIAQYQPEYNSTIGGVGRPGGGEAHFTAEGRKKLVAVHTGNQYRRGSTHSQATRKKLRESGLRNKDKWQQYAHLGPKASSRKVVCLDDGNIFESATAAASHYGVARSALIELCLKQRGRKTVGGKRFEYMEPK